MHRYPFNVIFKSEKVNPTDPGSVIVNVKVSAVNDAAVTAAVLVASN